MEQSPTLLYHIPHMKRQKKFKSFLEIHEVAEKNYLKIRITNIIEFVNYYDDRVSRQIKKIGHIEDNKANSIRKLIKPDIIDYLKHEDRFQNGYIFITNSKKEIIFMPNVNFMETATISNKIGIISLLLSIYISTIIKL